VGVFDLLATPAGLWIGHDTNMVGGEYHAKLAFFPTAGGKVVPRPSAGTLPGTVVQLGRTGANNRSVGTCGSASTGSDDTASKRTFDGSSAGSVSGLSPQNTAWGQARGAFMLSGVLYTGWADGSLCRRSFDGTTFGSAQQVDLHGNVFGNDLKSVTSMFFTANRIYYTKSGSATLFYRYFVPQDDLVGAVWFGASGEVNGIDFSKVSGMFLAGSKLYFVTRSDGVLRRIDWNGQTPVPGTMVAVSGPGVDNASSWASQGLTLYAGAGTVAANLAPRAVITPTCTSATCSFSSAGSSDDDGSVTAYSWNFGDGGTSTAASPTHTYAASGTYSVKLTVTDDLGGTGTTTRSVPVTKLGSNGISYVGESDVNSNATSWTVQVPGSVVPGDGLILTASSNSVSTTLSAPAGWSLLGTQTAASIITRIWQRVATVSDPGSSVTLSGSGLMKVNAVLLAYRGTAAAGPVATTLAASETTTRATHTTPGATATVTGSWVLSLWADKSSSTTSIAAPAGPQQRYMACGTSGGHICSLITDSGPVNAGTPVGGLTATADAASNADTMWTLVLTP
jgi:PKD repeat protein